ncbi:formate/nitrite transporter family protein [Streptococcus suis]|nr:formate/nitrite transporter family protein [Streptococcus suis]
MGCSFCSIIFCNTKVGHLDEHSYLLQATTAKLMKTPLTQFVEGIFANIVVNIAVFISMRMKDDTGRVISLIFIIFIFAFLDFEHVIANFSTFSLAFFANGGAVEGMTVMSVLSNFLFSGLGNFVGGGILIGFLYSWLSNKSKLYVD